MRLEFLGHPVEGPRSLTPWVSAWATPNLKRAHRLVSSWEGLQTCSPPRRLGMDGGPNPVVGLCNLKSLFTLESPTPHTPGLVCSSQTLPPKTFMSKTVGRSVEPALLHGDVTCTGQMEQNLGDLRVIYESLGPSCPSQSSSPVQCFSVPFLIL